MYEVMEIYELDEFLKKNKPSVIYFSTDDQDWSDPFDPLKMWISFNKIVVVQFPKRICLMNSAGQISIGKIKQIELEQVSPEFPGVGNILKVVSNCGAGRDICYKLLVS